MQTQVFVHKDIAFVLVNISTSLSLIGDNKVDMDYLNSSQKQVVTYWFLIRRQPVKWDKFLIVFVLLAYSIGV